MADPSRPSLEPSERSTLRRRRDRGSHDLDVIHSILDEGLICHVGVEDEGSVFVVPMAYATIGDDLYLHGAVANHVLQRLATGALACVTVTLLDGLVFSRAAFHHSMNYRSVMLFGGATRVDDADERLAAVEAVVEHVARGRVDEARPPTEAELRATLVVRLPISEGSAKIRTGPPVEDAPDLELAIWGGVLPLSVVAGAPIPDTDGVGDLPLPKSVAQHRLVRPRRSV